MVVAVSPLIQEIVRGALDFSNKYEYHIHDNSVVKTRLNFLEDGIDPNWLLFAKPIQNSKKSIRTTV